MAKTKVKIHFQVLGKDWKLNVLSKHKYFKRNGKNSLACTWSDRVIDLSPRGVDIETIRHELVHAYQKEMCISSMDEISNADMEEWVAELMGRRGPELIALADEIHAKIRKALVELKVIPV
jgi:hypothetical protein